MDTYGDNLGEAFVANSLQKYYENSVQPEITNNDYESLVNVGGVDRASILTFGDITINTYTGADETVEEPDESEGQLILDQKKDFYFKINSLLKFESYVNDPASQFMARANQQLKQTIDGFILGLYADAGSGNRVGINYTTGTVTVTVTTGECVGVGTVWTSAMAGLGFLATGHTKWYRIVAHATHAISSTSMYIQNDSDDDTSSYDGGAIAGAAYTIEAAAVKTVTVENILDTIDALSERLDENEIPKDNRWIVVNAKVAHLIRRSEGYTPAVESAYSEVVKKGLIGMISGFMVYQNEQVSGNNTTGYYIMAGHKSAITFALSFKENGVEDLIGNFGKAYKQLMVYGGKVLDERRKALAYAWVKVG